MGFFRPSDGSAQGHAPACRRAAGAMALAALLWVLASCGGTSGPPAPGGGKEPPVDLWPSGDGAAVATVREGCGVMAGPAVPGGHFIFTLTSPVLPGHAPIPRNGAERVVFAQLYETLVQVDCTGRTRPGLAERWTCTEDSTVWVFTIREGARFWDGTRVTAEDVRRAWCDNEKALAVPGLASPWTWPFVHSRK